MSRADLEKLIHAFIFNTDGINFMLKLNVPQLSTLSKLNGKLVFSQDLFSILSCVIHFLFKSIFLVILLCILFALCIFFISLFHLNAFAKHFALL